MSSKVPAMPNPHQRGLVAKGQRQQCDGGEYDGEGEAKDALGTALQRVAVGQPLG